MIASAPTIKVLHSHPRWLPRTQNWIYNQIKYLPREVECHVSCVETENLDTFSLPAISSLDRTSILRVFSKYRVKGMGRLVRSLWLAHNFRKIRPAIVHSHFGNAGYFDSRTIRRLPVKHVVTFYGLDVNMLPTQQPRWKQRYRSLFQSAHLFLCEGPHMADCLEGLGCPKSKVRVQHLGAELEKIPYRPRVWESGTRLKVLIAAAFREKKGIPYAIEALTRIRQKVPLDITIVGDATNDPSSRIEKEKILNTLDRCGLRSAARMLGFQPQPALMDEAYRHHIFLSPSITAADGDTEGGGLRSH